MGSANSHVHFTGPTAVMSATVRHQLNKRKYASDEVVDAKNESRKEQLKTTQGGQDEEKPSKQEGGKNVR